MVPSGLQNVFEFIVEGIENFQLSIMGERGRAFFPLVATLIIYVFSCNIQGLIPGSFAPTSNINTTVGFAIVIFLLTHIVGLKMHGAHYIKHFLGPLPVLAPLMFGIEVVSHLSRLVSLTLRLFGNVMGEDLVILILFVLAGAYFAPLPMMFLGLLTGFLQAFIITLLAMIYIGDAQGDSH
jgi:F-type H+-transporting ATPase subunit a